MTQTGVRILCFDVRPLDSEAATAAGAWREHLQEFCSTEAAGIFVYLPSEKQEIEEVRRAMWTGEPFLIAGRREKLLLFLDGLDKDSVVQLKDCAYWWLLSDSADLTHAAFPAGRPVVLNWNHHQHNIIRDALRILTSSPDLKGLSEGSDRIRKDILRIACGPTGPNRSVLILGESGCGKELVFRAVVDHSNRAAKPRRPTGGAWLNMEPGMAMTELVGLERNLKEQLFDGLLSLFSDGCLFFDDFESAPRNIQETLLRIMEDERGEYFAVGGHKPRHTNAWLIFATNRNLHEFLNAKDLRHDFFYRFGARIISIPPLIDRPADVPAIAQVIWERLWRDLPLPVANKREPLRVSVIRALVAGEVDWGGNTRTLRAALELVVSMMCDKKYNGCSQADLIAHLLARGRSPIDWLQLFDHKPPVTGRELLDRIQKADDGHPRKLGPSEKEEDPLEMALTPSEAKAKACLSQDGWWRFRELCRSAPPTKGKGVRVSVRLARIIWYISVAPLINWKTAHALTGAVEATVKGDISHLATGGAPLTRLVPDSKPPAYERIPEMFL